MWYFSDNTPNPLLYSRVPVVPRLSWPWWFGFVDFNITFDQQVFYILSWIIHVFWWVLTYNLFKDRQADDVNKKIWLPWFCTIKDHRTRQNVVRTSVTHSAPPQMPLFCSYHVVTSSVIYYWTYARQQRILFVKYFQSKIFFVKYFQTTKTMAVIPRKPLFKLNCKRLTSLFP